MATTTAPRTRLADTVARLRIVRGILDVDLATTGAVVRAVDAGDVEAGARALEPGYDGLGGYARRILRNAVAEAMTAAGPAPR